MGVKSSIRIDNRRLNKIRDNLDYLSNNHIEYGILEPIEYSNGATVAYVASLAETGFTLNLRVGEVEVPARPFFTQSIPLAMFFFKRDVHNIFRLALGASSLKELSLSLNELGVEMMMSVKETLNAGNFAPNTQYTLMHKLGDEPLKDTKLMYDSITYKVVPSPISTAYQF